MSHKTLIAAAAVAALASPLVAGDQTVEKATRYRAIATESAEPVQLPAAVTHDITDVEAFAPIEVFDTSIENTSSAQIEELGCCFYWNDSAEQVEELGPFYWNDSAEQVEELGPFYWNDSAEQVEELGPFYWNNSAEQVEELGCCFIWNQNADEIED